jgi:hypothetical protein
MLKSQWFELPLERELTLIKINQEVDECTDVEKLRENLKEVARQNAKFQHMISEMLKEQLTAEVEKVFGTAKIEEDTPK